MWYVIVQSYIMLYEVYQSSTILSYTLEPHYNTIIRVAIDAVSATVKNLIGCLRVTNSINL